VSYAHTTDTGLEMMPSDVSLGKFPCFIFYCLTSKGYSTEKSFEFKVPSSTLGVIERGRFICFQCQGDMSVEKAFEINQQSSERKVITEELEDLQRNMGELNQVQRSIKRCSVKEVIL
jgi:hypothetical protein